MMSSKYRYLNCGLLISVLLLALAPTAGAESAKEQLQGTIDSVVEVLRTIRSQEDIERNRKSLRQILLTRFDFAAMAQTSLGKRWNDLKGEEGEFVSAFTDFVEHSYMSTLGLIKAKKSFTPPTGRMENLRKSTRGLSAARGLRSRLDTSFISKVNSGWSTMQ
jgi:ABC-type transporter MlaC component